MVRGRLLDFGPILLFWNVVEEFTVYFDESSNPSNKYGVLLFKSRDQKNGIKYDVPRISELDMNWPLSNLQRDF